MCENVLFYGGNILPMTGASARAEALLVQSGRIAWAGSLSRAEELAGASVRRVDLEGHTLLPAFLDSHSHLSLAAQYQNAVDLSSCTQVSQITHRLKAALAAAPQAVLG